VDPVEPHQKPATTARPLVGLDQALLMTIRTSANLSILDGRPSTPFSAKSELIHGLICGNMATSQPANSHILLCRSIAGSDIARIFKPQHHWLAEQ